MANALAKASEKVWGGVIDLHDVELRRRLFVEWPVEEAWGIGPALAGRLRPLGVRTAADLVALPATVARDVGTVVLERLVRELNGIECAEFPPEPEPLKATAVTRCFGEPVSDGEVLREAMVRRAVRATEKIRAQGLVASRLIAFAHGSRFKPDAASASRSARLSPATHDPRAIGALAGNMAEAMFRPGAIYSKCGVMLEGLHPVEAGQGDLFASLDPRSPPLLAAIDGLNGRYGRSTVRLASEGRVLGAMTPSGRERVHRGPPGSPTCRSRISVGMPRLSLRLVAELGADARELTLGFCRGSSGTSSGCVNGCSVGERVVEDLAFDATPWRVGSDPQSMSYWGQRSLRYALRLEWSLVGCHFGFLQMSRGPSAGCGVGERVGGKQKVLGAKPVAAVKELVLVDDHHRHQVVAGRNDVDHPRRCGAPGGPPFGRSASRS